MVRLYERAPIVEAVVELRLVGPVGQTVLKRLRRNFEKLYDRIDDLVELELTGVVGKRKADVRGVPTGFQASTADAVDVAVVRPDRLVVSRRAPYTGWELLIERVKRDHHAWAETLGTQALGRLGVRYINRLDVPAASNEFFIPGDYMQVGAAHPDLPFRYVQQDYSSTFLYNLTDEQLSLKVTAGTTASQLLDHGALLLDIDVGRSVDVAAGGDDMWAQFQRMREVKNTVFESFITDKARKLFE